MGFGIDVLTGFAFGFALGHYWGWHHGWGWHGGGGWGWHHGIAHVNVYNRWGDHVYLSRHLAGDIGRDIGRDVRRDVRRDIGGRRFGGADVYAGRDGHVYRRDGVGHWQEFNRDRGWASVRGPTTEHEQWHQARELGQQRLGDFNRGFEAHAPAGGFHGGMVAGGGFHGFGGGFHGGGHR